MKVRLTLLTMALGFLLASCASTMKFDQTCITCIKSQRFSCQGDNCPKTFMSGENCLVTIVETGENIFLNSILQEEKITPASGIPVAIAKLDGKYYVTGNYFTKLWILIPKVPNEAKYCSIPLPVESLKIQEPVFDFQILSPGNNRLRLTAVNYDGKLYVLTDDDSWSIFTEGKVGGE